jgi:hypothetical protein
MLVDGGVTAMPVAGVSCTSVAGGTTTGEVAGAGALVDNGEIGAWAPVGAATYVFGTWTLAVDAGAAILRTGACWTGGVFAGTSKAGAWRAGGAFTGAFEPGSAKLGIADPFQLGVPRR